MPLTTVVHESLPYIDTEPTPSERSAALSLISTELPPDTTSHPLLPSFPTSNLSSLIDSELTRIASNQPLSGIELSRYEAIEPPPTSPDSDERHPESLSKWRAALSQAYTSSTYLHSRITNLALLEQFGKNAWLISNSQLEDILKGLERQLGERKEEIDRVNIERKSMQEAVAAEVKGLEETWKKGVGRMLETEVAAEGVRRHILERRRGGSR